MAYTHLIFGGIGTLVETSQHQLDAYNQAFRDAGIAFTWDKADYAESLSAAGGKNRLGTIMLDDGRKLTEAEIADVHERKTALYQEQIRREGLQLRNGAGALIDFAKLNGITLGWATTTSRENIDAIFAAVGEGLKPDMFLFVGDRSMVDKTKPDPQIYTRALDALGANANETLAVEDSPTGIAAATSAGLSTIGFPGEMTADKDMSAAEEVVDSLGKVMKRLETA